MGISSFESRFRSAIPDTPPEVRTPDSTSYSSRQSEERSWNPPAPPSPPMSNYDPAVKAPDMSSLSGKGSEETQGRPRDVEHGGPPRQQLPSLSSLFGPPPSQVRPFHSPLSDRPGSYPSASPLDRPHSLSGGPERPYSSSSFFPSPTTSSVSSQPRSVLDPRFPERPQFPPLSRTFPGPLSPHLGEVEPSRKENRSDLGPGTGQWSTQHDSNQYSLGSRDRPPYKPPSERFPSHVAPREESYREQLTPQTPAQTVPTTPVSAVASEGVVAKDGLGPKIWTGTHFLPRFVRAAEVPGEGMCYFYDDGSHCKTVIDGEAVNAHWGVTKAGKPRKRLAIACVTCREKKIKCDPDYPRCVQCEKFGRVCKFKNAPRGGHNTSPSTPPAEPEDTRRLGAIIRPPPDLTRPSSHHSSDSISPRTTIRPASPDFGGGMPSKRPRISYDHFLPAAGPRSPMGPLPDPPRSALPPLSWRQGPELPRIHEDVLCRGWQPDPRSDARV